MRKTFCDRCGKEITVDVEWVFNHELCPECAKAVDVFITQSSRPSTIDVQPVNQWISVKDELPDEMQDKSIYSRWSEEIRPSDSVLVLTTGGSYDVAWYSYVYNDWTTDNEAHTYKSWEIAFWQPLPEPPKDGDTE